MMKLTIQLFLKALLIGVAVNLSLLYAAGVSASAEEKVDAPPHYQKLEQSPAAPAVLEGFGD